MKIHMRTRAMFSSMREMSGREKRRLLDEIRQVSGLLPLLMKPRNRQRWSPDDRALLAGHLKRLGGMSPYLVVFAMPGGLLMLPALAWWLDRRRGRNRGVIPR